MNVRRNEACLVPAPKGRRPPEVGLIEVSDKGVKGVGRGRERRGGEKMEGSHLPSFFPTRHTDLGL